MKNTKCLMALLGLVCLVVRPADYSIVAIYNTSKSRVAGIGVNSDNTKLIATSGDDTTSSIEQFDLYQGQGNGVINSNFEYKLDDTDIFMPYVQWQKKGSKFYIQGFKGYLYEQGNPNAILKAEADISNDGVACIFDIKNLDQDTLVFLGHHEDTLPYNVTCATLSGDQKATYNTSEQYKGNWPNSIIVNQATKNNLVTSYAGYLALAIWDINTQQLQSEVLYPESHIHVSFQVIEALNMYLTGSDYGILSYDPRSKICNRIVQNSSRCLCLIDDTMLISGNSAGQVQWIDMRKYDTKGHLQVGTQDAWITALARLPNKAFLVATNNKKIIQLDQKKA